VNEKKEKKGASENATKIDSNKFSLGISKPSNVLLQSATLVPDTSSRDWNTSFQSMLEGTILTPHEQTIRTQLIDNLFNIFVKEAIPIVRTIIYELELAVEEKTIKPINAGGVAGGEKFVYNNM